MDSFHQICAIAANFKPDFKKATKNIAYWLLLTVVGDGHRQNPYFISNSNKKMITKENFV